MTPKQHYMNLIDRALSQPVLTHSGARLAWFTLERITEHCRARGWDVVEILGGGRHEEHNTAKVQRHGAAAREQHSDNRGSDGNNELVPGRQHNQKPDVEHHRFYAAQ